VNNNEFNPNEQIEPLDTEEILQEIRRLLEKIEFKQTADSLRIQGIEQVLDEIVRTVHDPYRA
jgi:hypothetical protein